MRTNSFTFIRLSLAAAVVFSHSFGLAGRGLDPLDRWSSGQLNFGGLAVIGFFAISGFLLSESLRRNPSVVRFCLHRAARILPGYWVALLLTALVLAPILMHRHSSGSLSYGELLRLGPNSALDYLANNWTLHLGQDGIGRLFAKNTVFHSVNGSLWTLYHEAMCYLGLLLLWAFRGLRPQVVLPLWAAVYGLQILDSIDHRAFLMISPVVMMTGHFFSFAVFRVLYLSFLSGMLIHQLGLHERWSRRWFGVAVAALLLSVPGQLAQIVWPITLPWILISLAFRLPCARWDRWGDWSYGMYIYAFPLQQCLALAGLQRMGIVPFILASLILSFTAGALSWHFIESPILQWARRSLKPEPIPHDPPSRVPGGGELFMAAAGRES